MNETRRCLYCQSSFLPSRHRPQQRVCSRPDCQRQRRTNSRRQKLATDVEYRQVVRDSQKQWWDEHPGYQKERRQANPELVESNRQKQHLRDQKAPSCASCQEQLSFGLKAFSCRGLSGGTPGASS